MIKSLEGDVGKALEDSVGKAGPGIVSKLKDQLGFAGVSGGQALAAGLGAAAPLIGATLSAAVIGGAGAAGVIGGVLLAAKDRRVQEAGAELGKNLMSALQKDAEPFIEPVLRNIGKIEVAFSGMNSRLSKIFGASSSFLDPLVNGALKGVDGILKGVESLVTKGKPVMDALGRSFATVGQATGHALDTIAGGSEEAAAALDQLSGGIGTAIESAGYLVRGLTELYGVLHRPDEKFNNTLTKWITGVDQVTAKTSVAATVAGTFGSVMQTVGTKVLSTGEAAGQAGLQMQTFADKMADAASKGRSLYDSQTDVAQAIADAKTALDKNGKSLDINTQKGRDNRKVLSDLAGKLQANYAAYVKLNGEGAAAQKVAGDNRAAFIKLATQFGISAGKAEALATQLGLIPPKKNTDFHANTHDAAARIAALQGQVNNLHGKTIGVHVSVTGTERLNSLGHRIGGFASAGDYFSLVDRGRSGTSRTGGPTPVNVTSEVLVNLDGRPFYNMAVSTADASARRQAWRAKVGSR